MTGNPIPYSGVKRGSGQELFTESIIALDVNTGKLRWYQQLTHHDIWDYDSTNATILYDRGSFKGIAHAAKTGWVYAFDRRTGKPVNGLHEVKVSQAPRSNTYPTQPMPANGWGKFSQQCPQKSDFGGKWPMAPDGKPYKRIGCTYAAYDDTGYTLTMPSALGGANWPPSSYSPNTGYMYICSKDSYMSLKSLPAAKQRLAALGDFFQLDEGFLAGPDTNPRLARIDGRLVAMNLRTGRIAWQTKWPNDMCYSGVATTAGNLAFVGRNARLPRGLQRPHGQAALALAEAEGRRQRRAGDLLGERQAVRRRPRGWQLDRRQHRREAAARRKPLRVCPAGLTAKLDAKQGGGRKRPSPTKSTTEEGLLASQESDCRCGRRRRGLHRSRRRERCRRGQQMATPVKVTVTMTDFKFKLSKASVPRNTPIVFTVINKGPSPHDFALPGKKTPVKPSSTTVDA